MPDKFNVEDLASLKTGDPVMIKHFGSVVKATFIKVILSQSDDGDIGPNTEYQVCLDGGKMSSRRNWEIRPFSLETAKKMNEMYADGCGFDSHCCPQG